MTTQAAFNGYLNNRLKITSLVMRTAINDQNLTRVDDFIGLTDQDIKDLCDNIRKPGGTIPNPNATVAGQPPTIANPGQPIRFVSIKWLRVLNYYLHHLRRIQRDLSNAREGGIRGGRAGKPGRGRGRMGGRGERRLKDNEITIRYYTSHEWWNMMNEAQRTKARSLRESNRHNSVSMQNQARRETGLQGNRKMSSVEREQPES